MKKAISLFLALMLCASLFVFPVLADNSVSIIMDEPGAPSGYSSGAYFADATVETKSIKIAEGFGAQKDLTVRVVTAKPGSVAYMLTNGEPDYTFSGSSSYDQYYYKLNSDGTYSEHVMGLTFNPNSTVIDDWFVSMFSADKTPSDMILIYNSFYADRSGSGDHTNINTDYCFCVVLGDGSTPTPTPTPNSPSVARSPQNVTVNGETVKPDIYNINGNNYFKLRDLAYMLNGTGSQFAVGYDGATNLISITTGSAYTPAGGELTVGEDKSATCSVSPQTVQINGTAASLTAYNIGGNNYFKLRELGDALGFNVDFDSATNTAIITSK